MLKEWALGSGQPTCVTTGRSINSLSLLFFTRKTSALGGCHGPKEGHVPPTSVCGRYTVNESQWVFSPFNWGWESQGVWPV